MTLCSTWLYISELSTTWGLSCYMIVHRHWIPWYADPCQRPIVQWRDKWERFPPGFLSKRKEHELITVPQQLGFASLLLSWHSLAPIWHRATAANSIIILFLWIPTILQWSSLITIQPTDTRNPTVVENTNTFDQACDCSKLTCTA